MWKSVMKMEHSKSVMATTISMAAVIVVLNVAVGIRTYFGYNAIAVAFLLSAAALAALLLRLFKEDLKFLRVCSYSVIVCALLMTTFVLFVK